VELAISSPAVGGPKTIAGTHCTYPPTDGKAEWAWVNTERVSAKGG